MSSFSFSMDTLLKGIGSNVLGAPYKLDRPTTLPREKPVEVATSPDLPPLQNGNKASPLCVDPAPVQENRMDWLRVANKNTRMSTSEPVLAEYLPPNEPPAFPGRLQRQAKKKMRMPAL